MSREKTYFIHVLLLVLINKFKYSLKQDY